MLRIQYGVVHFILGYVLLPMYKTDKVTYIKTERPKLTYVDPHYFPFMNFTCQRYERGNAVYYLGLNFVTTVPFDNNVQLDFYVFELLTNTYKRSFVEFHYKWCNLIKKDKLFGPTFRNQPDLAGPCPYPPGPYHLVNMTMSPELVPPGFPFSKGRLIANFTYLPKKLTMSSGYVDLELRTLKSLSRKN